MKGYIIFKHEIYDIISNKKFVIGSLLQLLLLLTIIPAFGSYLAKEEVTLSVPTMRGFIPLGIVDNSERDSILNKVLAQNEKLNIRYFDAYPYEALKRGEISAILTIPRGYDESSPDVLSLILTIDQSNIKRASAYDVVVKSIAKASSEISEKRRKEFNIAEVEPIRLKKELLKPVVIERQGEKYSSFFLGYLIPILLFFPIFMSGNLIVDSIVGEKERKTVELLLTSPIKERAIVFGKFFGIFAFITLQSFLWIVLLKFRGVPISNLWLTFFFISMINLGVISTATLLGVYSKNVKEANISFMLLYVFVSIALIISLSLEYFNPQRFLALSPFVVVSRLAIGEEVGPYTMLSLPIFLGIYSIVVLFLSVKLLKRDDITFGPRPSILELYIQGVGELLHKFESHPILGGSAIGFISGAVALVLSIVIEIALSISLLFFFGYSFVGISLLIISSALVEETLKPIGIFSVLKTKPRWIEDHKNGFIFGAISGLGFFIFENLFMTVIALIVLPVGLPRVLALRISSTLVVHLTASGLVGLGISRLVRRDLASFIFLLLLATLIHALFNLMLFRVML